MTRKRTHLKVGKVVKGNGEVVNEPAIISLNGELIDSVQTVDEWEQSGNGKSVIDCSLWTALPGLIDSHVHVSGVTPVDIYPELEGSEFMTVFRKRLPMPEVSDGFYTLAGVRNLQQLLASGVTTARDCGGPGDVTFWLRDGIRAGLISGPRLLISGRPVTITGGHAHHKGIEIDSTDEARKATRTLIKKGVDFIKVMATGGLGTPGTNIGMATMSVEEMAAVVHEAHGAGLQVAAHILGTDGVPRALEAGIDTFEHVWFINPDGSTEFRADLVEQMIDQNVVCSPTIGTAYRRAEGIRRKMERGLASHEEIETARWCENRIQQNVESLVRMKDMGLKLINGTDALGKGIIPFGDYAVSLELMVNGGIPPNDAIVLSTKEPAEVLGLNTGVIESGKLADLCLVEGDPFEDISVMWNVRQVYKDGRLAYDREKGCLL